MYFVLIYLYSNTEIVKKNPIFNKFKSNIVLCTLYLCQLLYRKFFNVLLEKKIFLNLFYLFQFFYQKMHKNYFSFFPMIFIRDRPGMQKNFYYISSYFCMENNFIPFFRQTQFTMVNIQLQQSRNFHSSLLLSTTTTYRIRPFALESLLDPGTF